MISEERIEKFWEWCGVSSKHEWDDEYNGYKITDPVCQRCGMLSWPPPSKDSKCLLPVDLNNLFRWAVPKCQLRGEIVSLIALEHSGFECCITYFVEPEPRIEVRDEDPAIALFLAIERLIEEGK